MKKIIIRKKKHIRNLCRKVLNVKDGETIESAIERKKYHILKRIDKRRISKNEFEMMLKESGISEGDTVVLHSGWRGCYSLNMKPIEVINSIENLIGENGLLMMPAYGKDRGYLDINNTPSAAGVLTEIFRKMDGVYRSRQTHFSVCAKGYDAKEICKDHELCEYSFDRHHPYYRAIMSRNAKIILLGLGRHSVNTPVFHFATVDSIKHTELYKKFYNQYENATVITETGEEIKLKYLVRNEQYISNKRKCWNILKSIKPNIMKKYGLNMIVFNGKELYDRVFEYCLNGGEIYKQIIRVI